MTRRDLPLVGAVFDRGWGAFAVVWLVATFKDLPSLDFSWFNFGLATGAALLAMGGLALTQALERYGDRIQPTSASKFTGSD